MMRLKVRDLKIVYLKRKVVERDKEANVITKYSDTPILLKMNVQSSDGRMAVERYGERLKYYKNCKYQGKEHLKEGDGICVYVSKESKPDYFIKSILDYSTHLNIELERILKENGD